MLKSSTIAFPKEPVNCHHASQKKKQFHHVAGQLCTYQNDDQIVFLLQLGVARAWILASRMQIEVYTSRKSL